MFNWVFVLNLEWWDWNVKFFWFWFFDWTSFHVNLWWVHSLLGCHG